MDGKHSSQLIQAVKRINAWYAILILVLCVFGARAFYVQVIRYGHYHTVALHEHRKAYQIPPKRGIILAHEGGHTVPLVLNQKLYTIYADPVYISHPKDVSKVLAHVLGGDPQTYQKEITSKNSRYVVLQRKVYKSKKQQLLKQKFPGIGAKGQDYRTYPEGNLASQLLGFVNAEGQGTYGIEQALNKKLSGDPGKLKAITDVHGVPLAADNSNTDISPTPGKNVTLTINLPMQAQLQHILKKGVKHAKAKAGSALIMDIHTGQVKAMADYPTYNPADYASVKHANVFKNAAVDHPIEVGSIMKTLTTAAALDLGVIQPDTHFYDPGHWKVDGFNITDISQDHSKGEQSIKSLLNLSLNTGATWELMQMGGGKINAKARQRWHEYMANHFMFGKPTNIEQGYEAPGIVPSPKANGAGINLTYANTAFGQAMTATPLQMGAALSAVLNGGTYYQPTLVSKITNPTTGKTTKNPPKIVKNHIVKPKIGPELADLMEYVVKGHLKAGYGYMRFDDHFIVGGKTGTAQIAKPGGGYYKDLFNGTYMGFVGGDHPQYAIVVFTYKPHTDYFAGTAAAQPIFASLAHMLIGDSYVIPKS